MICQRFFRTAESIRREKASGVAGRVGRKEITRPLSARPDDKRFRRRREIRFLVSGSQPARICHAPTNLPSTSSILGHLGSTGNYNIGLLDEEFEVAARKGAGSWHANPSQSFWLSLTAVLHLPRENMSHLLRAISHLSRGFV